MRFILILLAALVVTSTSSASFSIGAGSSSTSEDIKVEMYVPSYRKTVNGTLSNATTRGYLDLGYSYDLSEPYSLDTNATYLKTSSNDVLVVAESVKYNINSNFSLKTGLNLSYNLKSDSSFSVTDRNVGLGFQLGASYKINEKLEISLTHLETNNSVNYEITGQRVNGTGTIKFEQKSNMIGLNYNF